MKKTLKFVFKFLLILSYSIIFVYLFYTVTWKINTHNNNSLLGAKAPKIEFEGKTYRDLNKNGKLDFYKNSSFSIEERVEDLITQMTIEEKAGSIFITMIGINNDESIMERPNLICPFSFLMNSSSEMIAKKRMNHFNILASHDKEKISKALIADFDVSNDIIFELIFGEFNPTGKQTIQLPSTMKSVENQIEDLPFDLEKPLFDYGHGLSF